MLSRYRILGKLGAGGMGLVYWAEDISLKRPVAVKFLSGTSLSQEQTRARFLREAQTAAALNHPNVCTIYEVGEVQRGEEEALGTGEHLEPGTPFIAMELVEGRTLETIVRQSGSMPFDELLGIALQISDGMAAAHARGIVHRDLKPGNVMLTKEGRVKILDFGLAKPLEPVEPGDAVGTAAATASAELTREGRVIGTAAYMSPEQAKGEPVDSRSDIFSFGVMLYELVTGTRPFRGTTTLSTLAKIIEAEPEPIPDTRADIPQELRRIVRRCLQKKPEDRYNDTRDLMAALKALRQETTSGAPRMASRAAVRAPLRRRRGMWIAGVVSLFVVVAAFAVVFWPKDGRHSRLAPPTHRQLTTSADAWAPEISPDGKSILYVRSTYGQKSKLMVQDLAGGQPLEIYAGGILEARWSPSGTEIVVVEWGEDKARSAAIIPRLGGSPRRLSAPLPSNVYWQPAWSPDGRRIAIAANNAMIAIVEVATGRSTTFDAGSRMFFIADLDWSPQGQWLAAVAWNPVSKRPMITTFTEDGGSPKTVFEGDIGLSVRWNARGDGVYFLRTEGPTTDLWSLPMDPATGEAAGEPTPVLVGFELAEEFSISRDAHTLVCVRVARASQIVLAERDAWPGGAGWRTRALTTGTRKHGQPVLSPDGRTVAFVAGTGGRLGRENRYNLFKIGVNDNVVRQMTYLDGGCASPAWSPDGEGIAFVSDRDGAPRVWITSAKEGTPRVLEQTTPVSLSDFAVLTWAPWNEIVYEQADGTNFSVLDPATGNEEPLFRGEPLGYFQTHQVAPDGIRVAVRCNRPPRAQVWLMTRGGGSPRPLLDRAWAFPMGWSGDGKSVYVFDRTVEPHRVVRVPAEGGPAETIFEVPFDTELDAAVFSDGTKLVFSRVDATSDVWLVENFDADLRRQ